MVDGADAETYSTAGLDPGTALADRGWWWLIGLLLLGTGLAIWFGTDDLRRRTTFVGAIPFTLGALASALLMLPSVPLGIWLGEQLHRRVSERRFRQMVYALLICAALALLLR